MTKADPPMSGRVFLCAGHELGGGASANGLRESPYNALVGLLTVRRLRDRGVEAWLGPLTTQPYPGEIHAKTAWVAARARPDDLAVDIHLDINEPGCAAFAIERPLTLSLADTLAEHLSRATGLRCRGGMPDRETGPGRLGFLHAVPCHAVLVELCSMNTSDASFAKRRGARGAFARGLATGCLAAVDVIGANAQVRVGA
jgi:N-acetylmuramoyl-L-alanine amidase